MKSELLRKALMSKMANGGGVGSGTKTDTTYDVRNKEKMSPQQWSDYAKKQGWELVHPESSFESIADKIKRGQYLEYYNPKEYSKVDGTFYKSSDVGKPVNYASDTTYRPFIKYQEPVMAQATPSTSVKNTITEGQNIVAPKTGKQAKADWSTYTSYPGEQGFKTSLIREQGKDPRRVSVDIKTGREIDEAKTRAIKGKYSPVFLESQSDTQPKKKGGVVGKYQDGGETGDFDVSKIDPEAFAQAGELAGTGLDMLDRRDERSSIAGQTGVGALKGAGKGAALGTMIMPGIGTAVGAIGGAVIGGAIGASRGKKEKKERLAEVREQSIQAALSAQQYNPLDPNSQTQSVKVNKSDTQSGLAGIFAKGGTIKGAGTGTSDSIVTDINKKGIPEGSFITPAKNNEMAKGIRGMVLGDNPNKVAEFKKGGTPKSDKVAVSNGEHLFTPAEKEKITRYLGKEILEKLAPEAEENEMEKNKGGEMIKRADGSYSKRGLWDGIRGAKGSGKKPTPEMLKQEKEIKSELKKGGYVVKRSSERKGKTHVVIGPDGTKKYFGDSNLGQHPNDPARKKAFYARHEKNLKKNPYFRAFARETWAEGGTVGSKMNKEMLEKELMSKKAKGGTLTKAKAKEILHDKSVHGKPLTDKQRKYFGWVAGGKKNMGGIVGKYAMGGNVNRDWDWG